jgi:hypothetical protein
MKHFRPSALVCTRCGDPAAPDNDLVTVVLGCALCIYCAQDVADEQDAEPIDVNGEYDDD